MLGLTGGGSGLPYIRFSPSMNMWSDKTGQEIQLKKMLFDIDNVQTGWLLLEAGVRDWQPDQELGRQGPKPSDAHKRGFVVRFFSREMGWVEWSSNGAGPNMGLEALYTAAAKDRNANAGKLPIIEYQGAEAMKVGKGNTRKPKWNITGWAPRPTDDAGSAPVAVPEPVAPAPAKGEEF